MAKKLTVVPSVADPALSVVVAAANHGAPVDRALESLVRQTCGDWEALVVSPDAMSRRDEIQSRFSGRGCQIRFFDLERNGSFNRALNVGLWNARGAFIAYLDTDFEYAPSYLASIVERSHDVGATLSGYDVAGGLMRVEIRVNTQISRGGAVPVTCPTCISGIAHRRTLAISVGGVNELLEIGYEWELTKRIARTGCEIGVLPTSAGRRHLPPLTVDACGLVELTRDISGPVIDREAACGAGSQRRGTPPSGGVNGNLEIKKRRRSAMLGNCVAGRPLYDDSSIRSPDHAVGALPPAVGRRRTKVLFASPHSLIDPTCGAAIASLRGLELLHEQGLPCSVFTGTLLDASEEMLFDEILAKRRVPYETHAVQLGDTRIRLSFTSHGKVPVTVFRNGSTRSGWTDSENNAFIAAFERLLNYDRPDVLVNFGGDAISDRMMAAAKLRDIPIVAWIHNLAYTDQSHFQAADYAVVPSKFAQQYYVERVGLAAQVLPNVIDDPAIRVTRHDPRYVTFVNPHPTKGVFVFSRIALELQKARPDIPVLVVESRGKSGWLQQAGLDLSRCPNITVIENTPFPRKFYAQTKILLMPSLWEESFGLTTAEALLNGIPVLASNRGGNPEAVGDAGFLLDIPAKYTPESRELPSAEEVAPWIETIIRLWDDDAFYAAAVDRAQQHAERWRPEVLGPIYREFFENVCPQPGPPLIPPSSISTAISMATTLPVLPSPLDGAKRQSRQRAPVDAVHDAESEIPAISVIMPVFNGALFFDRSIGSLLRQSFPNWELCVVDDCSTDDTPDRLREFAAQDPRIRVLKTPINSGPAAAKNVALRAARGDLIAYLDCDDEFFADHLERVIRHDAICDVLAYGYDVFVDEHPELPPRFSHTWVARHSWDRIDEVNLCTPLGIVHRRQLLERVGLFDEQLVLDDDSDLWRRFRRAGAEFAFIDRRSGRYHVRPDSHSRQPHTPAAHWDETNSS